MILKKLKSRKSKHISKVSNHLYYLHSKLSKNSIEISELKGNELNQKVKEMK